MVKFNKEFLQNLAYGDYDEATTEVISDEIVDNSRWSIQYEMVFKHEGKFYETSYQRGATECQDESPYEYEDDEIEVVEVFPVEVLKTVYMSQKQLDKHRKENPSDI